MKLMTLVAVAAAGLTACQNNFEEITNEDIARSVVVKFESEEATRTSVDTSGDEPLFSWNEAESFVALEQTDALAEATSVNYKLADGKAHIDAEFALNGGKDEYRYAVVYPASGYVAAESINSVTLALPAEQTMAEQSYDPNADLMVSLPVTTAVQPTETQLLRFTRLAAVAKMSISNLNIGAGEQIERVEFTADGKALAGEIVADLDDPHAFAVSKGVSTVSVAATTSDAVYFNVLPTTLEAGDTYSVAVVTDKKVYAKAGSIPEGKSLVFEAGEVSRFNVNMTDVEAIDKWTLVRDASTLKEGDVVAIVAKDYDKALSTKLYSNASETSTSAKRGLADVVKIGNFLKGGEDLQQLTLMTGVAANTFSFYDEARGKFLVSSTTGSTHLINQVYCDVNTSFAISIDGGIATIGNKEGTYSSCKFGYRAGSYNYFFSGTSTSQEKVCLYRLVGVKGEIPVTPADVTVPSSTTKVVIPEEGAAEATPVTGVVFNYVGDWNISATSEAEWITFAFDKTKNQLTYTAAANEGTVRDASATITATMEGQEPLTWTFNLLQKGAPMEVSIAEFITKEKNENVTYKLTGVVTTVPSSYSNAYVIEDGNGNKANIKYLKTEDDNYVVQDDNMDVRVGDVITVTTVVTTTTKGTGGSTTYPSYFKGYYRLTATADKDLIDYEGGTATITLATSGNLVPAGETIKGAMAEAYDFVTFDYTENAATATATFAANNGASRGAEFNFTFGLASVTVAVGQNNHPDVKVGWFLVTDVNELAEGDKVIIAAKTPDETMDYAIAAWTGPNSQPTSKQIALMGNSIKDVTGLEQFTIAAGAEAYPDTFAFVRGDGRYLSNSSGSLKTSTTLGEYTSWGVTCDSTINDGAVILTVSKAYNSKDTIMFNYTTSNQLFNIFKPTETGKGAIYIYKYYNNQQ